MRAFHAIGAAFLMTWAIPAASHADATTGTSAVSPSPAPGCHCPGLQHRHAWRRHGRFYAWHRGHGWLAPIALAPWPAYNPPIPSLCDSAYNRVMTQYMRARETDREYVVEPGYVSKPALPARPHLRLAAGGAVFEYDGMAGGYVQLAQRDAQHAPAVVEPTP